MPLLENDKAIKEYYEEVKSKYPDIDFERFRIICRSPFIYIRNLIRDGELPRIIIKYLGKLRVFPSKIKNELKKEKVFFEKKITTEEEYITKKNFLENHLKLTYEEVAKDKDDSDREETID